MTPPPAHTQTDKLCVAGDHPRVYSWSLGRGGGNDDDGSGLKDTEPLMVWPCGADSSEVSDTHDLTRKGPVLRSLAWFGSLYTWRFRPVGPVPPSEEQSQ